MLVVGLAGGTASGKTTVVEAICDALGPDRVAVLGLDHYYRDLSALPLNERKTYNFDHPDAFDLPLILDHLQALERGEAIQRPSYSFALSVRTDETVRIESAPVVMVEGILALAHPELLAHYDLRIFVDSADDLRLIRRLERDVADRGRSLEETTSRYLRWVRPMHQAFVEPSKAEADIVLRNHRSPERAIRLLVKALGA
ncbi:MAG: uridine kinase [Myxococcales bacterium]|nr:uridine kinase [Myxococcales bacterium]